jgi:hypothetical protein
MAAPAIVAWYRADAWPRIRRVLLVGPTALTLGGMVVAVSFLTHAPRDARTAAAVAGFVLVAGGAIFTVVGMQRILRDDALLAIRTDGVMLQSRHGEAFFAWDELAAARWDAARAAVVLERTGADPALVATRYAGIAGPELAARIEQSRRRAALGMLR